MQMSHSPFLYPLSLLHLLFIVNLKCYTLPYSQKYFCDDSHPRSDFAFQATSGNVWRDICLLQLGLRGAATSGRSRDAGNILQSIGQIPTRKDYVAQNINSAEVEKP